MRARGGLEFPQTTYAGYFGRLVPHTLVSNPLPRGEG